MNGFVLNPVQKLYFNGTQNSSKQFEVGKVFAKLFFFKFCLQTKKEVMYLCYFTGTLVTFRADFVNVNKELR